MSKKYQNKKEVVQKYTGRIKEVKSVYDKNKLSGDPGFYNSKAYKDLNRRRTRALNRYDKREEINQRRRENNSIREKIEGSRFKVNRSETVFEAFSGKGRIFEEGFIQANKEKGFSGIIEKVSEEGLFSGNVQRRYFSSYADFRNEINKALKFMYKKNADGYEAFKWTVERSYLVKDGEMIVKYSFIENEE